MLLLSPSQEELYLDNLISHNDPTEYKKLLSKAIKDSLEAVPVPQKVAQKIKQIEEENMMKNKSEE